MTEVTYQISEFQMGFWLSMRMVGARFCETPMEYQRRVQPFFDSIMHGITVETKHPVEKAEELIDGLLNTKPWRVIWVWCALHQVIDQMIAKQRGTR